MDVDKLTGIEKITRKPNRHHHCRDNGSWFCDWQFVILKNIAG